MYFVYILQCIDQSLYTGITNDLEKKFEAHTTGKGSKYTRGHKPLKVVYTEEFPDKSTALKRELEIKSLSKSAKIALINKPR